MCGHNDDGDEFALVSRTLGGLPIVNQVLDRLGLPALLADVLPDDDPRLKLAPAIAIRLVITNLVLGREPLYGLGEWAARYDPSLLGLSTGDLAVLQRVGLGDALAEQLARERLGRAAQLRPLDRDRTGGGLDRRVAVAVAAPGTGVWAVRDLLVAGPAQERVDLGLHRRLDDQPGTQARDILDDLGQLTRAVEQGVDLGTDPVGR